MGYSIGVGIVKTFILYRYNKLTNINYDTGRKRFAIERPL